MTRSLRGAKLAAVAAPLVMGLAACGGGGSGETVHITDAAGNTSSIPKDEYSKSVDAQISQASAAKESGDRSRAATATPPSEIVESQFLFNVQRGITITGIHDGKPVSNACTAVAEKYKQWIPGGVQVHCVDKLSNDWSSKPGELQGVTNPAGQYWGADKRSHGGTMELRNDLSADEREEVFLHELGHSYAFNYLRTQDRTRITKAVLGNAAPESEFFGYANYGTSPQEAWARAFPRCILNKVQDGVDSKGKRYVTVDCSLVKQIFSDFNKTYKTNIDIIDNHKSAPPKPLHDRKGFDPFNMKTW